MEEGVEMARSGGNADVQMRVGQWEELEAAGAGRARTSMSSNASLGRGGGSRRPQQQQSPAPSTASTSIARNSEVAPVQGAATPVANQKPGGGGFSSSLWKLLFLAHLLVVLVLIIFLAVRGFLNRHRSFHPAHWYIPLLAAAACSVPTAAAWLVASLCHPFKALRASLWLAPLLTCAVSILLFDTGIAVGLAFAVLGLAFTLVQSLYACWVTPRLEYAHEVLAASVSATHGAHGRITGFVSVVLAAGLLWSGIWVLGAGGVAADRPRFAALYIIMLLLTMAWTMQVLRNVVTVAVSGFAYMRLSRGVVIDPDEAWRNAWTISLGSVCLGSAVVPVVGALRDTARTMNLVAGDADEFLFSCASCYMGVADRLIAFGNRWGFVQVGVFGKGFVAASEDTWASFVRLGMEPVIDDDLTSSFCFLSGVAGGALSALLGGIWVLVVDKSYVAAVSLYAFLIGYFMNRIAMAWPQACVSALHVAYAENPQIPPEFGLPITNRIRSLRRP